MEVYWEHNCDNCQSRRKEHQVCKYIDFYSQREETPTNGVTRPLIDHVCPGWQSEPNRFYHMKGKRFESCKYLPDDRGDEFGIVYEENGPIVKVKHIVKAYMVLNHLQNSSIEFCRVTRGVCYYRAMLKPYNSAKPKEITKLLKAMIPLVHKFNCIVIEDHCDKTKEDVDRAVALARCSSNDDNPFE